MLRKSFETLAPHISQIEFRARFIRSFLVYCFFLFSYEKLRRKYVSYHDELSIFCSRFFLFSCYMAKHTKKCVLMFIDGGQHMHKILTTLFAFEAFSLVQFTGKLHRLFSHIVSCVRSLCVRWHSARRRGLKKRWHKMKSWLEIAFLIFSLLFRSFFSVHRIEQYSVILSVFAGDVIAIRAVPGFFFSFHLFRN